VIADIADNGKRRPVLRSFSEGGTPNAERFPAPSNQRRSAMARQILFASIRGSLRRLGVHSRLDFFRIVLQSLDPFDDVSGPLPDLFVDSCNILAQMPMLIS